MQGLSLIPKLFRYANMCQPFRLWVKSDPQIDHFLGHFCRFFVILIDFAIFGISKCHFCHFHDFEISGFRNFGFWDVRNLDFEIFGSAGSIFDHFAIFVQKWPKNDPKIRPPNWPTFDTVFHQKYPIFGFKNRIFPALYPGKMVFIN